MNQRNTLLTGIAMAFLAVALGAFGAHGWKPFLIQSGKLDTYELAVRYQFYHAFMLLVVGTLMMQFKNPKLRYASVCFLLGILFFSGSLYILCFTGIGVLGAVTPLGGILFLLGYIFCFLVFINKKTKTS